LHVISSQIIVLNLRLPFHFSPYNFPTVFSFFLPEYIPDTGPSLSAQLVSPETMVVTMPNVVALLNGMFSLIKYGLSDCYSGFSRYPGVSACNVNALSLLDSCQFYARLFHHNQELTFSFYAALNSTSISIQAVLTMAFIQEALDICSILQKV
jgi:hypothetical protein